MKLKEIHRTSTFAWSPTASVPLFATGTVAGALDESFSNESKLEIWSPNFLDRDEYDLGGTGHPEPTAAVTVTSRFNRIAWGVYDTGSGHGVLAAGTENGELSLWDPAKILANATPEEALIFKNKNHDGPVKGLDFNGVAKNLLASGATNGQVFIWDLKDPSKPYTPGGRSTRLDEITSLSWNTGVQHILATSSSTGYTVVWDLRAKREVVALTYSSASGGPVQSSRRGQSAVSWHPDNATRLVTASEDDAAPVIMLWDLRNARAPEKLLSGHDKGILSLSWCRQDADLLLSSGKDHRTLAWNPQTAEIIGELPPAANWTFQAEWSPRNPDLLAVASFDGRVGIHSLQSTNESSNNQLTERTTDDVFAPSYHQNLETTLSLKQAPKWLRPPVSGTFGYGGNFVSVSNSTTSGQVTGTVRIRKVATESSIIAGAKALIDAEASPETLKVFCESRSNEKTLSGDDATSWKALASLFNSRSRDQLISILGFSKDAVAAQVAEAIKDLPTAATPVQYSVSLPEPEISSSTSDIAIESVPSTPADAPEPEVNLFPDSGTPQADVAADFFSSIGPLPPAIPRHIRIPHQDHVSGSAAATIGSPTHSTAASDVLKGNTFKIYPDAESKVDLLIAKALVLGDYESAVTLCISADRFADALLLAVKGGEQLLQNTQKAYFERSTTTLPYLRLFQSIVSNDLADIVQNGDLKEWKEIFAILCTYASQEEFSGLVEQLGLRLEFHGILVKTSGSPTAETSAIQLRKDATLCYLAAGKLEKVVKVWIEEMAEEEERAVAASLEAKSTSRYTIHAQVLQSFIEKVTAFRAAVKYVDSELAQPTLSEAVAESGARTYKLASLYDRYFEYADLLATQGLVAGALTYVRQVPSDYMADDGILDAVRTRLLSGSDKKLAVVPIGGTQAEPPALPKTVPSRIPPVPSYGPVPGYNPHVAPSGPTGYTPYAPTNGYANQPQQHYSAYPGQAPSAPAYIVPPPPKLMNTGHTPPISAAPTPAPTAPPPMGSMQARKDIPGWNDAPAIPSQRSQVPSAVKAIPSPFPNAPAPPNPYQSVGGPANPHHTGIAPPPRATSAAGGGVPPPPRAGASQAPGRSTPAPPPPKAGHPPPFPSHIQGGPRPPSVGPSHIGHHGPRPGSVGPYAPQQGSVGHEQAMYSPPQQVHSPPQEYAHPSQPGPTIGPYAPQNPSAPGPYAPPPGSVSSSGGPPPPPRGAPPPVRTGPPPMVRNNPPSASSSTPAPPPPAPQPAAPPPKPVGPKYPPGDRSHLPESVKPLFNLFSQELSRFKATSPKRMADDTERRINVLFDSLNCASLSIPVVQQLFALSEAFAAQNQQAALEIHLDMLTKGARGGDDITVWMPGLKQLINRMLG